MNEKKLKTVVHTIHARMHKYTKLNHTTQQQMQTAETNNSCLEWSAYQS